MRRKKGFSKNFVRHWLSPAGTLLSTGERRVKAKRGRIGNKTNHHLPVGVTNALSFVLEAKNQRENG